MAHAYYAVQQLRSDRYDMRQTRYKHQFETGNEHPHDLCASSFTAEQLRELVQKHNFDCDLSALDSGEGEAQ